jgi:hypothetical protein
MGRKATEQGISGKRKEPVAWYSCVKLTRLRMEATPGLAGEGLKVLSGGEENRSRKWMTVLLVCLS